MPLRSSDPHTTVTPPTPDQFDRIHALWDELADHDTTHTDAALECLQRGLCALVGAQNATWIGAVRMGDAQPDDPLNGWRPRSTRRLHANAAYLAGRESQLRRLEGGQPDPSTIRNTSLAGQFRTHLLKDLVDEEWFDSPMYRSMYKDLGYHDAIWAGMPINEDAECYFGFYRGEDKPSFDAADGHLIAHALRGLRWFMRQQMLAHGLLVASSPLTSTEHKVLQGLLSGLTEKQIAAVQGQSFNTTHTHVKRLFRKYGVRNRGALMALWLGRTSPD